MSKKEYICDEKIIHEDVVSCVKNSIPCEHIISSLASLYKILGDKTRCKILYCLDGRSMCVCDIAASLQISKSLVSHQLSILKKNGIVKRYKSKKEVYYTLDDEHINKILDIGLLHIFHKYDN